MVYLSDKEISKQEELTGDRLKLISNGYSEHVEPRPKESLIDLMEWAKKMCLQYQRDENPYEYDTFIHNKISMDGSFLRFCEEVGAKPLSLHTDALTSWQTPHKTEVFLATGIWKITINDFSFYHCALFHKGNQNEDEVSYFVIVKRDTFDKYLSFRNQFTEWQKQRERNSFEIEVIGGDAIPYNPDMTWDDICLDENLKQSIISTIEGFLKSKDIYHKMKVSWKTGCVFWGARGTGKTTALKVAMGVYKEFKPVTIQLGSDSPDELLEEAFQYATDHAPSLLYFEDLQELIKHIDMSHFLQLMDGVQNRDGIFTIATGNDFSHMEDNLKSRPRRFDRFFEFPLPNLELSKKYLAKYFGDILSDKKIESISKKTVKRKLTFAHLQELYFNSVYLAIHSGREIPNEQDIGKALEQVVSDKTKGDSNFSNKNRDITDEIDGEDGF
jgi:hypothetical protein